MLAVLSFGWKETFSYDNISLSITNVTSVVGAPITFKIETEPGFICNLSHNSSSFPNENLEQPISSDISFKFARLSTGSDTR